MTFQALTPYRALTGYFLSTAAASLVILIILLFLDPKYRADLLALAFIFGGVLLYTSLPSLIFIVACERNAIRELKWYLLFSGTLVFVGLPLVNSSLDLWVPKIALIFTPAGLTSGLVYWYVAGRHSGNKAQQLNKQDEVMD